MLHTELRDPKPQIDDIAQGYSKVLESDVSEQFLSLCQSWLGMYWGIKPTGTSEARYENIQRQISNLILDGRMERWLTGVTTQIPIRHPYCLYLAGIRANAKTIQCNICYESAEDASELAKHLAERHVDTLYRSYRL